MTDLLEPGVGQDDPAADVELAPRDVLAGVGEHRVALERAGAALPGEVHAGTSERPADAATPEPRSRGEADDGPDPIVGPVLVAVLPRDRRAQESRVGRAGLDRAPADRLAVQVGDQPARRAGAGIAAVRLALEPLHAPRDLERLPPGPGPYLVFLTLAVGRVAAIPEDRPQVRPGRFVRGHDRDRRRGVDADRRSGPVLHGQIRSRNASTLPGISGMASAS